MAGLDAAGVWFVRANLTELAPRTDELGRAVYASLFAREPAARAPFPPDLTAQRHRFVAALTHVVGVLDKPDRLEAFLTQLGREHRRHGVTPELLDVMGAALLDGLRAVSGTAWTPSAARVWHDTVDEVVAGMARGLGTGTGPLGWDATVVEHERRAEDLAVVRLQVDGLPALLAGQHLAVTTERRPGLWRTYSPATPPNEAGQVELHVRSVPGGWVSPSIVAHTGVGDRWRVADPAGVLRVDTASGRDVLMVAGGTGLAPLRSLLGELSRRGGARRVHLFVGGRHPGDLYDLRAVARLATTNPWLTVVPVVESVVAPWTRFPPVEVPPGINGLQVGTLVDVVTGYGSWSDRQALVCGSPAMVRATKAGLIAAGMPAHHVWHDPLPSRGS